MHAFTPVHLFIALTGVADYWRLTGSDRARELLLSGGAMARDRGRTDAGFFYIADGRGYRNTGEWPILHSLPVLDALYEVSGDVSWIEIGVYQLPLLFRRTQARTNWGKETNWAAGGPYFAYAFRFFETARKLGMLRDLG